MLNAVNIALDICIYICDLCIFVIHAHIVMSTSSQLTSITNRCADMNREVSVLSFMQFSVHIL